MPAAENAEAGDKHARTEDTQASGSPKKGAKKPKTDEAGKDQKADNGSTKGLDSAAGDTLKPSSPKKGGAALSKEPLPDLPASPKKGAPSSPKKGASSPKKGGIADKVEEVAKKA